MKFEILLERTFPHPIERVWRALSDPAALGQWLMETDFAPEQGRAFTMWCDNEEGGRDTYHCRVLEIEPPPTERNTWRMVWSWMLAGRESEGATRVELRLAEQGNATTLTLVHSGDRDPETVKRFKSGWPVKLDALERVIRSERYMDKS